MLGVQVSRQIVLVLTGKILGTVGTTDEVARQKRIQLVTGTCDLPRIHEIEGSFQDIARALTRQRLKLLELFGSLVVEPRINAHVLTHNTVCTPRT